MAEKLTEIIVPIDADVKSLEKTLNRGIAKLKKAEKKLSSIGKNLSVSVGAPILAVGGGLLKLGNDFDKAMNIIAIGTGKVGKDLAEMEKAFDSVFESVPDGAETVAGALTSLNTLTGSTGDTLIELSKSVLDASRLMGEDASANASKFGQTLTQWKVPAEDGVGLMDDLFKITQDYDIGLSDLMTKVNDYGVVLKNAGFSVQETALLMGRMNAAGHKWAKISPGLNKAFRDMAKDGINAKKGIAAVIKEMKGAENRTDALSIAMSVFGSEGAQRMTDAILEGTFSLDDLGKALGNNEGLVEDTTENTRDLADEFGIMKNEIALAAKPLAKDLLKAFKKIIPKIKDMIGKVQDAFKWFQNLSPETKKLAAQIAGAAVVIGPLVVGLGLVVGAVGTLLAGIKIAALFLVGPWGLAIAGVVAGVALVVDYLGGWDSAVKKTKKFVSELSSSVKTSFDNIKNYAKLMYEDIKLYLNDKFGPIIATVEKLVGIADKAFFGLYDAVVGNSYIPDMVNETEKWMGKKLKKALPDNAKKNTTLAAKQFENFQQAVEDVNLEINSIWGDISGGFGDAIAGMIIDGDNFRDNMEEVFKNVARMFISAVAKMGVEWLAFQALQAGGAFAGGAAAGAAGAGAGTLAAGATSGAFAAGALPLLGVAAGIFIADEIFFSGKSDADKKTEAAEQLKQLEKFAGDLFEVRKELNERITELTISDIENFNEVVSDLQKELETSTGILGFSKSKISKIKNQIGEGLLFDLELFDAKSTVAGRQRLRQESPTEFLQLEAKREKWFDNLFDIQDEFKKFTVGDIDSVDIEDFRDRKKWLWETAGSVGIDPSKYAIPALANGGIAIAPTLALIGEGGESEAVIPLSKLGSMMNNDSGGDRVTNIYLDSRLIGRSVAKNLPGILNMHGAMI